jgi:hypothetical protein
VKAKGIGKIFKKIIAKNSPNLKKDMPVQEASRTPNRHEQNITFPWHSIVKTISTENRKEY